MSKRAAGVAFCAIAALLYVTLYLAAGMVASGSEGTATVTVFRTILGYDSGPPVRLSLGALVAGIVYLAWAEYEAWTGRTQGITGHVLLS